MKQALSETRSPTSQRLLCSLHTLLCGFPYSRNTTFVLSNVPDNVCERANSSVKYSAFTKRHLPIRKYEVFVLLDAFQTTPEY